MEPKRERTNEPDDVRSLSEAEDFSRAILESASEAIIVSDDRGRIVMVNARAEALFGYRRAEILGQPLEVLVPERHRAIHERHRRAFAEAPRVRPMGLGLTLSGRRKDGTEFPVEISLSFTDTRPGKLFMAFVTDITERQRAFEAMQRSEAKARAILENASEGVVVADPAGRIVTVNAKTERMFGYSRDALIGQPLEILLPERFRRDHIRHRANFFADPRTRPMGAGLDLAGRRADGTEFPVEISLSAIETEDGFHALAFVSDITQRLAIEHATRQAERLAALGQLAAGVAHEVNNPIGIISSRIDLMLMEAEAHGLPATVVDDLKVLQRHAARVISIAGSLLSFARESPRDRGPVDVNAVVRDTLALVEKQITRRGIRIETHLAPVPSVLGHANALQQVVLNLLANAGDALGDRGTITITTATRDDRVTMIVADDGPGIPADVLSRIFDPFFTTKAGGTGLGLSVSYGIVHDHGGRLEARSEPGRGTVFTMSLPAQPGG